MQRKTVAGIAALLAVAGVFAILLGTYAKVTAQPRLRLEPVASFNFPWAMTALPDGGFLVTERAGRLAHVSAAGNVRDVSGVPPVQAEGQVGLHDIVLAPDYAQTSLVYLTWVDGPDGGALHLGRARFDQAGLALENLEVLWRASVFGGGGHPGAMIALAPDGHIFLTSGDRQLGAPAQVLADSRGKILRLTTDGAPAAGNPFPQAPEVWSYGHRNPYGLVFDGQNRLWSHEMGPRGGDELNLIEGGRNYGWPLVSEGSEYSGGSIPVHATRPEMTPPLIEWSPVIAPAGMVHYDGAVFPEWQGSLLIGGLASEALVRVEIDGDTAHEAERWEAGNRIRDVIADNRGNVYLLEDGGEARLLRLSSTDR